MEILTRKEACEYIHRCDRTMYKLMKEHRIPFIRACPGGKAEFLRSDLDKYLMDIRVSDENYVPLGQTYRKRRVKVR